MSTSAQIKSKIIEKLELMNNINVVYDYPASNESGRYPMAMVVARDSNAEMRSTAHNLRERSYWIRIYQEMIETGQGPDEAERIILEVADEVEQAFDQDTTLSGTVNYCTPISWNGTYRNAEHDTRILEGILNTVELVDAS